MECPWCRTKQPTIWLNLWGSSSSTLSSTPIYSNNQAIQVGNRVIQVVSRAIQVGNRAIQVVSRGIQVDSRGIQVGSRGIQVDSLPIHKLSQDIHLHSKGILQLSNRMANRDQEDINQYTTLQIHNIKGVLDVSQPSFLQSKYYSS